MYRKKRKWRPVAVELKPDMMSLYYDRKGRPCSIDKWVNNLRTPYKRVALTQTKNYAVSTVWLGLDHSWWNGRLIFETMIFGEGVLHNEQWRYRKESTARRSHGRIVRKVRRYEKESVE